MLGMLKRLVVGALRARVHGANPANAGERGNPLRMFRARWSEVRGQSAEYAPGDIEKRQRFDRSRLRDQHWEPSPGLDAG